MGIELQQLRQVVALAEHGSFVRAAVVLHISQPALSRSIQGLEQRLETRLFHRRAGGITPTDQGRLFIERARDILRLSTELTGDAIGRGPGGQARVAIGGGPFPCESFLGPAAARLVEQFPYSSVEIRAYDWDELLRQLRSRELDFFVAETSTLTREADLHIERLSSEHALHFFARASHPLAGRPDVSTSELMGWPFATPSRIPPRGLEPLLRAYRAAAKHDRSPRSFPAAECNGLAAAKGIVRCSDAISVSLLSCIATELASREFVLLGTEQWMHLQYGIVSLRGGPWTQTALTLRDYVIEAERETSAQETRLLARYGRLVAGRKARPRRKSA
jgi:DNA-binding transcriptional LysR family regulator